MKKLSIITRTVFLSALVLGVVSCHDDKGNYDYAYEGKAVTIARRMSENPVDPTKYPYVFTQGEEIVIEPEYTINDKSLREADLAFEWRLGDKIVSTEKVLKLDAYPTETYTGLFSVIDTRYKQQYTSQFGFQVDPAYTEGWAILSEQNGAAQLGYLHIDTGSEEGDYEFIADVYGKANDGATLEVGSCDMAYHQYEMDGIVWGLSIVQPGAEGPIDLNPQDMSVWGKLKNNFLSDASQLQFKSVSYKKEHVYAITESGDVYMREEGTYGNYVVPQTGKFPNVPAYAPGGLKITKWLNNCRAATGIFYQTFTLAYNDIAEQCVMLRQGKIIPFSEGFYTNENEPHLNGAGWDGTNSYPDIVYPGPEDLSEYNVIAFEQAGPNYSWFSAIPVSVAIFLQKKSDGKYYLLSFDFFADENNYQVLDIDLMLFFPLPDTFSPEAMIHCGTLGGVNKNIFLTDKTNREVHYIDLEGGTIRKIYTSASPITALHPGEVGNGMFPGIYDQLFVVGTESGDITVIKVDDEALALGNAEVVHTFNPGVGKITGIEFLSNNWMSF